MDVQLGVIFPEAPQGVKTTGDVYVVNALAFGADAVSAVVRSGKARLAHVYEAAYNERAFDLLGETFDKWCGFPNENVAYFLSLLDALMSEKLVAMLDNDYTLDEIKFILKALDS